MFRPSLAQRLAAEAEYGSESTTDRNERGYSDRGDALDLARVLAAKPRFVIIGGPGVGKTTTLKWLAITSTLPGEEGKRLRLSYGLPEDPLIPVYVRFRQFAERVLARDLVGIAGRVGLVSDFLRAELEGGLAGGAPTREKALQMAQYLLDSDKTLFLFDGLDEVADEGMRRRLFEAVADLMQAYKAPRVIVTSRPYAFRRDKSPLDLALFEPLPLNREARRTFAHQWYRAVRRNLAAPLEEAEARARADDLARESNSLSDLSEVPLLLSILALVHFNRQGLPLERATLYDYATLAMLGHWERDPAGRDLDENTVPTDWARRLRLNETEIRKVVEHLAQHVQLHSATGEFSSADAIKALAKGLEIPSTRRDFDAKDRGELLLRLLVDRSGLVQERSPDVFAFVHLSFQEYLTSRWFIGRGDVGLQELAQLSLDGRHGEVCRLAVASLSAEQDVGKDEQAATLIRSLGSHSPALAAACLLEAPRVRLEQTLARHLARAAFSECTDRQGDYYSRQVIARLIWVLLRHSSDTDQVLLEILSDSSDGLDEDRVGRARGRHFDDRDFHRFRRHELSRNASFAVLASRPARPLAPDLLWVLQRLAAMRGDAADDLPRHLAALLLIEAGAAKAQDHAQALVYLLTMDDGDGGRSSVSGLVLPRVEQILTTLWSDDRTRMTVRAVVADDLSTEAVRDEGQLRTRAWRAAKFLVARGERTLPGLADAIIRAGLHSRSRHQEVIACLHTLVEDPTAKEAAIKVLKVGLENADSDVRRGCASVLVNLGLIPPAAAGLDDDPEVPLADSEIDNDRAAALAENLWSEEPATAWRVAKALIDCGRAATPGVPQVVVNSGFITARSTAMQCIRKLHCDPAMSASVLGALFSALTNTSHPVATAAGLLLVDLHGSDSPRFLRRLTRAVLRDPNQINEALPQLQRLIHDDRTRRPVLEAISEVLGEKPDRRVASGVARMLAGDGITGVPNLANALVQHGFYQASDHGEVTNSLKRMLEDSQEATATRRALFDGLASEDRDVQWGAASFLWESGSRTDRRIARALAGPAGLGVAGRREQARSSLLELFSRPRTAIVARESLERAASAALHGSRGHSRNLDHVWAVAECLVTANAFHADGLAEAMVVGGFQQREDHSNVLAKIGECKRRNAEFENQIDGALWNALGDEIRDVQWGAARALIEANSEQLTTGRETDDDGTDDDDDDAQSGDSDEKKRVKSLSRLWVVLIREAAVEPLAAKAMATLAQRTDRSSLVRQALVKLLDESDPEVACAAAYQLLGQGEDDLPAAAMGLIKFGLTDTDRRGAAIRTLDKMLKQPALAPVVVDALTSALWLENGKIIWAATTYLLERGYAANSGILRGLTVGGLMAQHRREAETRLRGFLSEKEVRPGVIDALNVAMYHNSEERFAALPLLVESGAPLHDRVVVTMDELARFQPWATLALLALTNRQEEAIGVATRLGRAELIDILGRSSSQG